MLIKNLRLSSYRNHHRSSFEFDDHLNIIIGNNGTGKTNILESITLLSNARSFRTSNDRDLIEKGEQYSVIDSSGSEGKIKVVINQKGKSLFYNDQPVRKTSEFIGIVNAVLFKPADIELFRDNPKERRRILDIEIGKVSPEYLKSFLRFSDLLKDKNRLLKEDKPDLTYLELINDQMAGEIRRIILERLSFFRLIEKTLSDIYSKISGTDTKISITYKNCCDPEKVNEKLKESFDKDLYYHYATLGPHHEDYSFFFDGYEINSVASQGQKRMVMIAFKLAIVLFIQNRTGKIPVILLDDIFSELDENNQERLMKALPENSQVIITGTDINGIRIDKKYRLIKLEEK